ncbi:acetylgalactosaminyl-O-glycosyl-glycoprotein beta-1,3-N-acetylglucosaminyltransferase-like [Haliotis rufescens]|uniref:acetylgalactosaminyl-O-glycosyl-glycoprotein beta-1,3-N-acetylglucosaminyltransferase-like n=1 Tax=Haliotis rufescens TaxID=6454 RepID=UPI00201E9B3D|nr:acetylgalactosaminyl-O-glycosyl-glycoprotein beta-1,3-N-acetylglucosaminyltransferase-like [Haliotis rufescens]
MKRLCPRKLALFLSTAVAVYLWFCINIGKSASRWSTKTRSCCIEKIDISLVEPHITKLEKSSSIVEDLSFPVSSSVCQDVSKGDNRVWLLIAVISATAHFQARNAIRQTWGSTVNVNKDSHVCMVFIIGTTNGPHSQQINKEIHQYGDIVQINKEDTYKNVVFKSIAMLKWAILQVTNVQFLLKLDDDVYFQMTGLSRILSSFERQSGFIMGHREVNAKPIRNSSSRYHISSSEYSGTSLPHYMRGGSYLISGDLIRDLLSVIPTIPLVSIEDVYITGICAAYVSAYHAYDCGFKSKFSLTDKTGLDPEAVTIYEYGPETISLIWNLTQNKVNLP